MTEVGRFEVSGRETVDEDADASDGTSPAIPAAPKLPTCSIQRRFPIRIPGFKDGQKREATSAVMGCLTLELTPDRDQTRILMSS